MIFFGSPCPLATPPWGIDSPALAPPAASRLPRFAGHFALRPSGRTRNSQAQIAAAGGQFGARTCSFFGLRCLWVLRRWGASYSAALGRGRPRKPGQPRSGAGGRSYTSFRHDCGRTRDPIFRLLRAPLRAKTGALIACFLRPIIALTRPSFPPKEAVGLRPKAGAPTWPSACVLERTLFMMNHVNLNIDTLSRCKADFRI